MSERAREAAARAIAGHFIATFKAGFGNSAEGYNAEFGPLDDDVTDTAIEETKEFIQLGVNAAIDAFLAALKADGYKLVRREASDEMFTAADNMAPRDLDELARGIARYGEDVFYEVIPDPHEVWSAMWDAAPEPVAEALTQTADAPASQPHRE